MIIKCDLCPIDKKPNEAVAKRFGVPACKECIDRIKNVLIKPEIKSAPKDTRIESIKDGRKQYAKELLQPFREGEVSKEYLDAYPKQAMGMVKEGVITQRQHDNAKPVWGKDIY